MSSLPQVRFCRPDYTDSPSGVCRCQSTAESLPPRAAAESCRRESLTRSGTSGVHQRTSMRLCYLYLLLQSSPKRFVAAGPLVSAWLLRFTLPCLPPRVSNPFGNVGRLPSNVEARLLFIFYQGCRPSALGPPLLAPPPLHHHPRRILTASPPHPRRRSSPASLRSASCLALTRRG